MSEVRVRIPTMLATLVRSPRDLQATGDTVGAVLDSLFAIHPELRVHVLDESGEVRSHVAVFNDGRTIAGLNEPVSDGGEVTVLQAVSGG
jgi:molybdopterin converting factor small subunit